MLHARLERAPGDRAEHDVPARPDQAHVAFRHVLPKVVDVPDVPTRGDLGPLGQIERQVSDIASGADFHWVGIAQVEQSRIVLVRREQNRCVDRPAPVPVYPFGRHVGHGDGGPSQRGLISEGEEILPIDVASRRQGETAGGRRGQGKVIEEPDVPPRTDLQTGRQDPLEIGDGGPQVVESAVAGEGDVADHCREPHVGVRRVTQIPEAHKAIPGNGRVDHRPQGDIPLGGDVDPGVECFDGAMGQPRAPVPHGVDLGDPGPDQEAAIYVPPAEDGQISGAEGPGLTEEPTARGDGEAATPHGGQPLGGVEVLEAGRPPPGRTGAVCEIPGVGSQGPRDRSTHPKEDVSSPGVIPEVVDPTGLLAGGADGPQGREGTRRTEILGDLEDQVAAHLDGNLARGRLDGTASDAQVSAHQPPDVPVEGSQAVPDGASDHVATGIPRADEGVSARSEPQGAALGVRHLPVGDLEVAHFAENRQGVRAGEIRAGCEDQAPRVASRRGRKAVDGRGMIHQVGVDVQVARRPQRQCPRLSPESPGGEVPVVGQGQVPGTAYLDSGEKVKLGAFPPLSGEPRKQPGLDGSCVVHEGLGVVSPGREVRGRDAGVLICSKGLHEHARSAGDRAVQVHPHVVSLALSPEGHASACTRGPPGHVEKSSGIEVHSAVERPEDDLSAPRPAGQAHGQDGATRPDVHIGAGMESDAATPVPARDIHRPPEVDASGVCGESEPPGHHGIRGSDGHVPASDPDIQCAIEPAGCQKPVEGGKIAQLIGVKLERSAMPALGRPRQCGALRGTRDLDGGAGQVDASHRGDQVDAARVPLRPCGHVQEGSGLNRHRACVGGQGDRPPGGEVASPGQDPAAPAHQHAVTRSGSRGRQEDLSGADLDGSRHVQGAGQELEATSGRRRPPRSPAAGADGEASVPRIHREAGRFVRRGAVLVVGGRHPRRRQREVPTGQKGANSEEGQVVLRPELHLGEAVQKQAPVPHEELLSGHGQDSRVRESRIARCGAGVQDADLGSGQGDAGGDPVQIRTGDPGRVEDHGLARSHIH